MLEAEKAKESRGRKFQRHVWFRNSLSLFRLVLDLHLNTSSNFHHYYTALWQGDLTVLLTITATTSSPAEDKAI